MKFSCGECQAKYQIPDERVAGRKLKIRCRKCGAAITLRGDPTVEGIAGIPLAPVTVEWHVSIDGDQHGPYATDQMAGMLRAGQLGWEAYVWREGYGDWKTADESDTLVKAVAALGSAATPTSAPALRGGVASAPALRGGAASAQALRGGVASAPALRGGAASAPSHRAAPHSGIEPYDDDDIPTRMKAAPEEEEQPTRMAVNAPVIGQGVPNQTLQPQARSAFAARAHSARTTSYGSAPPSGYASIAPAVMAPPPASANVRQLPVSRSPRVSANQALTAERHEDSVLFSANNIVSSSASQAPTNPRAGYAAAEGSGLIDIRALAALAHSNRSPVAQPASGEFYKAHPEEPLPAIAHQAGTFSRIDSLSPFERPAAPASKAVPIAIIVGSAMIAAAAFLAVYLTQQPAVATPTTVTPPPAAAAQPVEPEAQDTLPTAAEAVPADQPAEPSEPIAAAAPEAEEPEAEPAEPAARTRGGKTRTARGATRSAKLAAPAKTEKAEKADRASSSAKTSEPEPAAEKEKPSIDDLLLGDSKPAPAAAAAPEPAKPKEPAKSRSIDDLLETAVDKSKEKSAPAAAAPASPDGLPETPSRDEVRNAMRAVEGDVKACAEGQNLTDPTATVALTIIGATGRVQSVRVTGNQGTVGTCIARAVRGATFPKFSKPQMTINFPFKLK